MFDNFKNLIRKGEKFIMVEGGKPAYVVMTYEDYEGMLARRSLDEGGFSRKPEGVAEAHTAEAPHLSPRQEYTARTIADIPNLPQDISKIRLEDLPL
ncbi:MAG: hypothetical protein A3H69_00855 [Candidatus Sungbacteria bacterium RIFCSPLOWO2_02_FULL_47_9]|uniref:Antitoxin n=1 Tax=Candidatus Sungbacteria bacterium RIFCSPHIGHO2_01_FULL_47_32 TaxID=1802264 RepID=A0A1G2K7H6_9BACT|nr:MAG: hypothetical protein UX72_C0016G0012 [Parcubacteria group bacterium GW2011_GWA2_47_10]OGZ94378.1 MAG: hypothetical protein A2633_02120 [Candidatus Sungbacteria bacterium RIFCSPHIGHO2_01_FULL_47_32]OHA04951.1 MAG: hypothetical protein A3A28_02475 [Candidatus Sungbacteria bacterium RIFCSPLOWO2_01_FULL_47_32]OHA11846.1 MAG: hypothetical protein A3H69_00855 [Candidatus Sungbacteria bacterium RIFCSPLOWO2_02_FULL_47_9]